MQTHSLYCPKCDEQIEVPFATEIYARGCTNEKCDCPAAAMWPSKVMYERHIMLEAKKKQEAEDALNAPLVLPEGRGPVTVLTPADLTPNHVALVDEAHADIPGVTMVEKFEPSVDKAALVDDDEDTGKGGDQGEDEKGGSD